MACCRKGEADWGAPYSQAEPSDGPSLAPPQCCLPGKRPAEVRQFRQNQLSPSTARDLLANLLISAPTATQTRDLLLRRPLRDQLALPAGTGRRRRWA
jgi:hypothetical protein